jgi:Regulator of G protein signaling domain
MPPQSMYHTSDARVLYFLLRSYVMRISISIEFNSSCGWIPVFFCLGGLQFGGFCDVALRYLASRINENPELREKFQDFAIRQYCIENLHFVDDVAMFKRFFNEKGDSWQRLKAKFLLETYIIEGSNLEVNISAITRGKVIAKLQESHLWTDQIQLQFAFDEAVDELLKEILRGVWQEFQQAYKSTAVLSPKRKTRVVANLSLKVVSPASSSGSATSLE